MTTVVPMKRLTLRQARTKARMTQDQLAAAADIDQTTISAIECGRRTNPSFETVTRLAKALGIAPSQLKFEAPQPSESVAKASDRAGHADRRQALSDVPVERRAS